jgi:hypothetical protein
MQETPRKGSDTKERAPRYLGLDWRCHIRSHASVRISSAWAVTSPNRLRQ